MNRLYTKAGDDGTTSLVGGVRVLKCDVRVEAYGTIDELNSWIGLIRDCAEKYSTQLIDIQRKLFIIGSCIADESGTTIITKIRQSDIENLEFYVDELSKELSTLSDFLIPGGQLYSSYCQIARTICRKAERNLVNLSQNSQIDKLLTIYLNRLSDYLFVLARIILKDFNKSEITLHSSL